MFSVVNGKKLKNNLAIGHTEFKTIPRCTILLEYVGQGLFDVIW